MPKIQFESHLTYTSFAYHRDDNSKPFKFKRDEIPEFSQQTTNLFDSILDDPLNYQHPQAIADKALSKHSWLQIVPATAESTLKIGTCAAIVAGGYSANCYITSQCDPMTLPSIITDSPHHFNAGLAAGVTCGGLAELWSNVRRRWAEGDAALNELQLAISAQTDFLKANRKDLKTKIKAELSTISSTPQSSPSKISKIKSKSDNNKNERKEMLESALKELRKASNFDKDFRGISISKSELSDDEDNNSSESDENGVSET